MSVAIKSKEMLNMPTAWIGVTLDSIEELPEHFQFFDENNSMALEI